MTDEQKYFLDVCAFAQAVKTVDGPALLIGGDVIQINGPRQLEYADLLATALRRSGSLTQTGVAANHARLANERCLQDQLERLHSNGQG